LKGDLSARTTEVTGHGGDRLEAYLAEPLDAGPHGGVVVIHHMPGYDEGTKEITRKFAAHGYLALCPNLYSREAPGESPAEASAKVREAGGVPDERLTGDIAGCVSHIKALPESNGKVGTIGYCSGGRQSLLAACRLELDAAVDCYGAFVVNPPPPESGLRMSPVVDLVEGLSCPLLGLFGAEDQHPSPEETAELERALSRHGKNFEFHTFEDAGHAFFATERAMYRPEVANEGWKKVFDSFGRYLD
jgi:carboxymethylenebutenolidase